MSTSTDKVYGFKVSLKHRKGLWRVIEIKGGQILIDAYAKPSRMMRII